MTYLSRSLLSCIVGVTGLISIGAYAGEIEHDQRTSAILQSSKSDPLVTGAARFTGPQRPAFLDEVAAWLSSEFELPAVTRRPAIAFVPAVRLAGLRRHDPQSGYSNVEFTLLRENPDILSVYVDDAETIFLSDDWSGGTPADLSVLVHEMVHHIQHVTGLRFACPEERERMAFAAQEKWLARYGSDLLSEFGIDPLTLLVRTTCLY